MHTQTSNPSSAPVYTDPTRSVQERVDDLVSRMTLEEKISQMVFDAPAIERLDVPEYNWWNECLHGVGRAGIATVFPQAIGLAATWNVDLMHRVATATSDEARAKHHDALRKGIHKKYFGLTFWSPNINIFRDPRWGRGQETYGECPHLTARMGVAFVQGLQGKNDKYLKLVATPKHYAVHSGPEINRHTFNAVVDERDLRETYLPHFETCVKEAKAYSVMGAYNRTNGEPCCASPTLLGKILRQEWGFGGPSGLDGYVVSDCEAILDIYENHKVVETPAEAAAMAVKEGCDLNCGVTYPALLEAVELGLIDKATIDRSVKRLFTARFRLGMFDPPEQVSYAQIPYEVVDSPAHRELALQVARESIVMLKNEGDLLPLDRDIKSIAVIGPNADDHEMLLGNYRGTPSHAVTILEGIRNKVSPETKILYARGCSVAPGMPALDPIPSSCLRPTAADENGKAVQTGLTGTYYGNRDFRGEPARVQIDPLIDFDWKATTPVTGRMGEDFAVRWTGSLVPPVTGMYKLGVNGCNQYRLYLDGEPIVELDFWFTPVTRVAQIELEAGRVYTLQLDYVNRHIDHDPQVQLLWAEPNTDLAQQAIEAAHQADIIVLALGLSARVEGEEMPISMPGFQSGDRAEISLPAPQEELLRKIHDLGKPVVLVLLSGSAIAVPWADEHIPAILNAWYPGEEGGTAVADVMFGDYNPAGRLPVTFYRSLDDLPPFEDYRMDGRTYRHFRGEPLYPFGHGLSYTRFAYSSLSLSTTTIPLDEAVLTDTDTPVTTISVDVQNVGQRAGDEVVQLYISDLAASVPVPIRQLAGFKRIHLAPGETKKVTFAVTSRQLSLIDDAGHQTIEPGTFEIAVGGRQPNTGKVADDTTLIGTFEVSYQ